jgi:hypothetical protein
MVSGAAIRCSWRSMLPFLQWHCYVRASTRQAVKMCTERAVFPVPLNFFLEVSLKFVVGVMLLERAASSAGRGYSTQKALISITPYISHGSCTSRCQNATSPGSFRTVIPRRPHFSMALWERAATIPPLAKESCSLAHGAEHNRVSASDRR